MVVELTIRVVVPEEIIQTWDADKIRRFVYAQADEAIGKAIGMLQPKHQTTVDITPKGFI